MAELTGQKENLKASKNKNNAKLNRIVLTEESTLRVDGWLQQINSKIIGKALNRNALVNWIITVKENIFNDKELSQILKDFYDPLKALEFTLCQAKEARKRGESLDLQLLLNKSIASPKKPRKPKKIKEASNELKEGYNNDVT